MSGKSEKQGKDCWDDLLLRPVLPACGSGVSCDENCLGQTRVAPRLCVRDWLTISGPINARPAFERSDSSHLARKPFSIKLPSLGKDQPAESDGSHIC